ncbi:MAG: sigma-70 family RNA polymerase sigma factor [Deltaproteobacteria bacterium]|nr:sigma-70 family RNA polymerase sigma factor [Deltaproteobacteria bacterium]
MLQLINETDGADNYECMVPENDSDPETIDTTEDESENPQPENDWKNSRWDYVSQIYFREMATYSTLTAEDEFHIGFEIRRLRQEIWKDIFLVDELRNSLIADFEEIQQDVPFSLISIIEISGKSISDNLIENASVSLTNTDQDEILLSCSIKRFEELAMKVRKLKRRNSGHSRILGIFDRMYSNYLELLENKHRFVRANLRLVISVARKYHHGQLNLIDLIQEGNIGLMKAVDRYDPDRGYRFSTYAAWWIRHSVSRASADKGRTVRLPVHFIESYQQLVKVRRDLLLKLGRKPSTDEIAREMGISRRKVDKIESYLQEGTLSLNRKVNSDDSRTFMEMLEDPETEGGICSSVISSQELQMSLEAIEKALSPMEKDIILKRYGLEDENSSTLKEIGEFYNLSRERIRQIQESAIRKIRVYFGKQGML